MEVFGYAIGFFSFILTGLTGVLTYLAWRNGQWMKQAHGDTQALIRETQALIKATHDDTMTVIRQLDRTIERLGELIVADGERTRELVRQLQR